MKITLVFSRLKNTTKKQITLQIFQRTVFHLQISGTFTAMFTSLRLLIIMYMKSLNIKIKHYPDKATYPIPLPLCYHPIVDPELPAFNTPSCVYCFKGAPETEAEREALVTQIQSLAIVYHDHWTFRILKLLCFEDFRDLVQLIRLDNQNLRYSRFVRTLIFIHLIYCSNALKLSLRC